jgi:protein phosphatase 1 regulatory subunit 10
MRYAFVLDSQVSICFNTTETLLPSDISIEPRGGESVEAGIQTEREKTALIASYMSISRIPESASDLHPRLGEPSPADTPTVQMLPGAEIITSSDAAAQAPSSLSDLLAQISTPAQPTATAEAWGQQLQQPSAVQQSILQSLGLKSAADITALLSSVSPDVLAMLQQQQPPTQASYSGDNGYGDSQQGYSSEDQQQQGYWNDGGSSGANTQWNGSRDDWDDGGYRGRGRGFGRGRGRGRGRDYTSKKLCNFWAKG